MQLRSHLSRCGWFHISYGEHGHTVTGKQVIGGVFEQRNR